MQEKMAEKKARGREREKKKSRERKARRGRKRKSGERESLEGDLNCFQLLQSRWW